ncbi:MAG: hypothetical protein WAV95_04800 [Azonexus sp.]
MKRLFCALISLFFAGCAYNYKLPNTSDTPPEGFAKIRFSNTIKVSQIDDLPFQPKFSIWVGGSHEVTLPAGPHTFRFKYNAVSMNGGYYTKNDSVVSRYLDAGEEYEITSSFREQRIYFAIARISDKSLTSEKE